MTVIERFKKGDFNYMSQEAQADGSVIITLTRRGYPHVYQFKVRNLYKADEVVEWEKIDGAPVTS